MTTHECERGRAVECFEPFGEKIKAKEPIAVAWRRVAVIEDRHGEHVKFKLDAERAERAVERVEIDILHLDLADMRSVHVNAGGLVLADNLDARLGNLGQVVVEAFRRARRRKYAMPGAAMIVRGPVRGSAAHDRAGEQDVFAPRRGIANLPRDQYGRRGHDHLQAVFNLGFSIEEENVLCAGTDVDGQYFHSLSYLGHAIRNTNHDLLHIACCVWRFVYHEFDLKNSSAARSISRKPSNCKRARA